MCSVYLVSFEKSYKLMMNMPSSGRCSFCTSQRDAENNSIILLVTTFIFVIYLFSYIQLIHDALYVKQKNMTDS